MRYKRKQNMLEDNNEIISIKDLCCHLEGSNILKRDTIIIIKPERQEELHSFIICITLDNNDNTCYTGLYKTIVNSIHGKIPSITSRVFARDSKYAVMPYSYYLDTLLKAMNLAADEFNIEEKYDESSKVTFIIDKIERGQLNGTFIALC